MSAEANKLRAVRAGGTASGPVPGPIQSPGGGGERPWIGVHFTCANRYTRVLRSVDGAGYLARCPACGRGLRFRVAEGGSRARLYEVTCS